VSAALNSLQTKPARAQKPKISKKALSDTLFRVRPQWPFRFPAPAGLQCKMESAQCSMLNETPPSLRPPVEKIFPHETPDYRCFPHFIDFSLSTILANRSSANRECFPLIFHSFSAIFREPKKFRKM